MRVRQSRVALVSLLVALLVGLLSHGLLGLSSGPAVAAAGTGSARAAVSAGDHTAVTHAVLTETVARALTARPHAGRTHGEDLVAIGADRVVLPGAAGPVGTGSTRTSAAEGDAPGSLSRAPPAA